MSTRFAALVLSLVCVAPTVARAQIEEPRIPLQTKLSEINRFRTEYAENYNKKDMAAVAAMYSTDIMQVSPTGTFIKGLDATRADLQAGMPWPHIVIESDSLAIYGNTAVDVGTVKLHPANGGEIVSRYLVVLRRDMNGWKLVRIANTPVGPQTGM